MASIAILVPSSSEVPADCLASLMGQAAEARGLYANVEVLSCVGVHPHSRARHLLHTAAYDKNVDYALWIDNDMIIPKGSLALMKQNLELAQSIDPNAVIVSGLAYIRGGKFESCWSVLKTATELEHFEPADDRLYQIYASGLAYTLVDMNKIRQLGRINLFQMETTVDGVVWEDSQFYKHLVRANLTVFGAGAVRVSHRVGSVFVNSFNVNEFRTLYEKLR